MTKTLDSVRRESDCLIVLKPDAIDDLEPVFTAAGYVLTTRTVPASRFCGVWSLRDVCWINKPSTGDFKVMTDTDTEAEIMMHIAYQQWYIMIPDLPMISMVLSGPLHSIKITLNPWYVIQLTQ